MDIIAKLDQQTMEGRIKAIPDFAAGDTLRVHVRVKEGERSRVQVYEGVCVARHNKGASSSFTVRKLSFGEGVERVFPLFSPVLDKIEVVRRGDVRRAKLYYLRGRTGKAARIAEKSRGGVALSANAVAVAEIVEAEQELVQAQEEVAIAAEAQAEVENAAADAAEKQAEAAK